MDPRSTSTKTGQPDGRPPRSYYRLFSLGVTSELPLSLPAAEADEAEVMVEVVTGPVAARGALLWHEVTSAFTCRRDGAEVVLAWPAARFRIGATRVVVDSQDHEAAAALLVPAVWSVVLAAHGLEALHGSAVEHDGRAIAILGASGSGKSTAALTLLDRGWRLVTDDLLTFDAEGHAVAGPPYLRLCPDRGMGRPAVRDAAGKVRLVAAASPEPVSLAALVVLADEHTRCAPLRGAAAVAALLDQVYNPVLTHPGQARRRFELALDLVDHVPIYGAPPRSLVADQLEGLVKSELA